jgi:hypothetical protein
MRANLNICFWMGFLFGTSAAKTPIGGAAPCIWTSRLMLD